MSICRPNGGLRAAVGLFLILQLALAGCSLHADDPLNLPVGDSSPVLVQGVPFFPQQEFQCGPASLAMALSWSGVSVTPEELISEVYTESEKGSLQTAMIAGARRHGRVAYVMGSHHDIVAELDAGNPVVVLVNLGLSWYPVWHYAVAVGYDRETNRLLLNSADTERKPYPVDLFQNIWARSDYWGLLVMPPDRLPAVARESAWLNGAVGLERTGHLNDALTAYAAATSRWPGSYDGWMGVGNTSYALGDIRAAADAYKKAIAIRPDDGIAYNNLAYALNRLDQREEAVNAVQKAIACGGPLVESFRRTLDEIKAE